MSKEPTPYMNLLAAKWRAEGKKPKRLKKTPVALYPMAIERSYRKRLLERVDYLHELGKGIIEPYRQALFQVQRSYRFLLGNTPYLFRMFKKTARKPRLPYHYDSTRHAFEGVRLFFNAHSKGIFLA